MSKDKIIFLSSKNPHFKTDWSGIPFFLHAALSEIYDVEYVPLPSFAGLRLGGYYFGRLFFLFTGKKYVFDYGLLLAVLYGIFGTFRLRKKQGFKFILSPAGLTELAFLKTSIPLVSYGDCSTLQLFGYYPALMQVSRLSRREIRYVEGRAFGRVTISAFSSDWASDFVKTEYGKTCITIPFGANLFRSPHPQKPKSLSCDGFNLLFIGVDWIRKGGEVALEVHRRLLKRGFNSRLTILGTKIPDETIVPEHVNVIRYIDKGTDQGQEQLHDLFETADFFLMPTFADCTPIVIAEAYAYGIPVLATNTGGITSMIIHSVTGYLLNERDVDAYEATIAHLVNNRSVYSYLSGNCLENYSSLLNWNAAAQSLNRVTSTISSAD